MYASLTSIWYGVRRSEDTIYIELDYRAPPAPAETE